MPVQILCETLLGQPIDLHIHEDNSSSITAIKKGYSPSLRALKKTHRLSLGFLHDMTEAKPEPGEGAIAMFKQESESQKGDYFTKITPPKSFQKFLDLFRIRPFVKVK